MYGRLTDEAKVAGSPPAPLTRLPTGSSTSPSPLLYLRITNSDRLKPPTASIVTRTKNKEKKGRGKKDVSDKTGSSFLPSSSSSSSSASFVVFFVYCFRAPFLSIPPSRSSAKFYFDKSDYLTGIASSIKGKSDSNGCPAASSENGKKTVGKKKGAYAAVSHAAPVLGRGRGRGRDRNWMPATQPTGGTVVLGQETVRGGCGGGGGGGGGWRRGHCCRAAVSRRE
ncbi:hypothetical protein GGR56DRAFT_605413 [Xylariaceae sp. FL0804]|nr:hypothetical protein GGR56DRAFT_605413 [Xylariaceae sp. FL0804]